jgi:transposase
MLTEKLWSKLREILLQFSLYNKAGLRRTVEGILFRMRTGVPWRDLPEHFGKWNSIYKAFNHWSKKDLWKKLFNVLRTDSDLEWVFIDGRYVKAHQHSAGAAGGHDEYIGKSRAGNTSEVHLAVNAYGLPEAFTITGPVCQPKHEPTDFELT